MKKVIIFVSLIALAIIGYMYFANDNKTNETNAPSQTVLTADTSDKKNPESPKPTSQLDTIYVTTLSDCSYKVILPQDGCIYMTNINDTLRIVGQNILSIEYNKENTILEIRATNYHCYILDYADFFDINTIKDVHVKMDSTKKEIKEKSAIVMIDK